MATPSPEPEAFLTTDEVLAYLQVNLRTVYRLIDAGKLPAVRAPHPRGGRRGELPRTVVIDAWLDGIRRGDGVGWSRGVERLRRAGHYALLVADS